MECARDVTALAVVCDSEIHKLFADTNLQLYQLLAFNFSKRILFRSPGFAFPLDSFITCMRLKCKTISLKFKRCYVINSIIMNGKGSVGGIKKYTS